MIEKIALGVALIASLTIIGVCAYVGKPIPTIAEIIASATAMGLGALGLPQGGVAGLVGSVARRLRPEEEPVPATEVAALAPAPAPLVMPSVRPVPAPAPPPPAPPSPLAGLSVEQLAALRRATDAELSRIEGGQA